MLARLRVKRTRWPFAETSKFSSMLAPLNSIESAPSWPSMVSLPSPGSQLEDVVAGAHDPDVVALVAVDEVVAVAAEQEVDAVAAEDVVVAGTAVDRDLDERGQVAGGAERVVAAVGVEDEVLGRAHVDGERGRVDAVEADPGAVGRRRELLGAVAADDLGGVDAGAALVEVGVVARVPDHPVVAGLAERLVVGVAAGQDVVVGAAEHPVEPALAERGVVAGLADEDVVTRRRPSSRRCRRHRSSWPSGSAPLTSSIVRVSLPPRPSTRIDLVLATRRRAAEDRDGAAVDQDLAGRVARDRQVVVLGVAEHRQDPQREDGAVGGVGGSGARRRHQAHRSRAQQSAEDQRAGLAAASARVSCRHDRAPICRARPVDSGRCVAGVRR